MQFMDSYKIKKLPTVHDISMHSREPFSLFTLYLTFYSTFVFIIFNFPGLLD